MTGLLTRLPLNMVENILYKLGHELETRGDREEKDKDEKDWGKMEASDKRCQRQTERAKS